MALCAVRMVPANPWMICAASGRHGEEDDGSQAAIAHLQGQGYTLREDWCRVPPSPDHRPSERDVSAIEYLI